MGSDIEHQQTHDEVRVIAEFGDVEGGTSYVEHGMAREIMRLRKALDEHDTARMTAELLLERERRTSDSHFGMSVMYEKEYERARAILAALREPSEAVMKAAVLHYSGDLQDAIRAAVAAAEKEVQP